MELKHYPKPFKDTAIYYLVSLLLAAEGAEEAFKIIGSFFGEEEKLSIGRRAEIAHFLLQGNSIRETTNKVKSSTKTVNAVYKNINTNPEGFKIVLKKFEDMNKEYKENKYIKTGGSMVAFKKTKVTNFNYKDIKR